MTLSTPTEVKEAVVSDGIEQQRANGAEPTPYEVERLAVSVLDMIDRKRADAKPRAKSQKRERKPGALEREFEKRGGTPGTFGEWSVERTPIEPGELRQKTLRMSRTAQAIARRLRLLRSDPEWMFKLQQINPLATNGSLGPTKRIEAERHYWRIIAESCHSKYGPLFSVPKPLMFDQYIAKRGVGAKA